MSIKEINEQEHYRNVGHGYKYRDKIRKLLEAVDMPIKEVIVSLDGNIIVYLDHDEIVEKFT